MMQLCNVHLMLTATSSLHRSYSALTLGTQNSATNIFNHSEGKKSDMKERFHRSAEDETKTCATCLSSLSGIAVTFKIRLITIRGDETGQVQSSRTNNPSEHNTSLRRPSNVDNGQKTLYRRQNVVVFCVYSSIAHSYSVSTIRRFDVHPTSITVKKCCTDNTMLYGHHSYIKVDGSGSLTRGNRHFAAASQLVRDGSILKSVVDLPASPSPTIPRPNSSQPLA